MGIANQAKRILLIDDEPSTLLTYSFALRRFGYEVTTEIVARRGLQSAREGDFDLVIVDYRMPELLGNEIIKTLRIEHNPVPILLISASKSPLVNMPSKYKEKVAFRLKPMVPSTLKEAVESLIGTASESLDTAS
ncbi:response regulator [Pelagicoccus albus]|uniref:Response regulator n=1 Tax=Pelagicoccus albus TaxID=415222 RepID=A0A7X1B4H7_9BACT|nr:response regulator [Pelagicoccus albus]MBC2605471.1 response regulator [Pelagicoccus albus]